MTDSVLHGLALALAIGGMGLLALALSAHWRQFAGPRPLPKMLQAGLRIGGTVLLAGAFVACLAADPLTMAVLVWTTMLTVAAGLVAVAVTTHAALRSR